MRVAVTTAGATGGGGVEEIENQSTVDALNSERRTKRDALRSLGIEPYPMRFDRTNTAAERTSGTPSWPPTCAPTRTWRWPGVSEASEGTEGSCSSLIDVSGSTQFRMSAAELEPTAQEVRDRLDLGDWLGEATD
jgi:hypothetical protein